MTDFDRWAITLALEIRSLTTDYHRLRKVAEGLSKEGWDEEIDPDAARAAATSCAAQALMKVLSALGQSPYLNDAIRGGPLLDLVAALEDLRCGRRPEFFMPTPNVAGKLAARTKMMKIRAVASVLTLRHAGLRDAEARRRVAKIFSSNGHRGKKGGMISPRSLFGWCAELAAKDENPSADQRIIAQALSTLPDNLTEPAALRLVQTEAAKRL